MPADRPAHAPLFRERLHVPVRWWLIATIGVGIGGAEVFGGFGWTVAVVVYAVMGTAVALFLVTAGWAEVRVDAAGLHAGGRTLPVADIAVRHGARTGRRPRSGSGLVATRRRTWSSAASSAARCWSAPAGTDATPYWLVSTRHPERLLAALERDGAVTP